MQKSQLIIRKPTYRHGQLLLEEDFLDEQSYHASSHARHVKSLHGFGVARGLDVATGGDAAITVSPGFAIDREGNEILLAAPETLELHGQSPSARFWVALRYEAVPGRQGAPDKRIDCLAVLRLTPDLNAADIRLAQVTLDSHGRAGPGAISYEHRDVLRTFISAGSVTPEALGEELRRGWISMPFRPMPLARDNEQYQPPFRVGATEARAFRKIDEKDNPDGAAGTMEIVVPPGVRRIEKLRIAGESNDKGLSASLFRGGFDDSAMKRVRDVILQLEVPKGAYYETRDIPEKDGDISDPDRTLAIEIRSQGFASVSLVALQVSY